MLDKPLFTGFHFFEFCIHGKRVFNAAIEIRIHPILFSSSTTTIFGFTVSASESWLKTCEKMLEGCPQAQPGR